MIDDDVYRTLVDERDKANRRLGEVLVAMGELRKELADAIVKRNRAIWRLEFSQQSWAERSFALRDLAKRHGIWPDVACILANGRPQDGKAPNYPARLNQAKFRAEAAEKERDKAVAELVAARDALEPHLDRVHYPRELMPWWQEYAEAARLLKERAEQAAK